MVSQVLVSLDDIRARIDKAKKEKEENSIVELDQVIAAKQAAIDIETQKQKMLETVSESLRKEKDQLEQDLRDAGEVKEFMTPTEFEVANQALWAAIEEVSNKMKEHQTTYTEVTLGIREMIAELTRLRDRKTAMRDPYYKPKFSENQGDEIYLRGCRDELKEICRTIKLLPERINEYMPDREACVLTVKFIAAKFRKIQKELSQPPHRLTPPESIMCARCSDRLSVSGNSVNVGYLPACKKDYETDWAAQCADLQTKLTEHFAKKQQLAMGPVVVNGNGNGNGHSKVEEEEVDPDETKLINQILNSNLINNTANKRLAIYGGISTRSANAKMTDWLHDVLKLERLEWYECVEGAGANETNRLIHSIKQGGTDMVLIFFKMTSHSGYKHVVTACKTYNMKPIMCSGTSKRMAVTQIALNFGIELDKIVIK